jgi:hypothetical protein
MSRVRRAWTSGVGVMAAGLLAVGAGPIAPAVAAPEWTPAQQVPEVGRVARGVLGEGTSAIVGTRESSSQTFRGTALVEARRPVGGAWSAARRAARFPAFGCQLAGGVEGPAVAAGVWCRDDTPAPGTRRRFSRAFVWTPGRGWLGHDMVNTRTRVDVAPSGNVVFAGGIGRTTHLLVFNADTGQWNEITRPRSASTEATWAAIDNDRDLLVVHQEAANGGSTRLLAQRRTGGDWRRARRVDFDGAGEPPAFFEVNTVDLNGRGDAVVTWVRNHPRREGNTQVLKTAVGTGSGWDVQQFGRPRDIDITPGSGLNGAGVVTLAWHREDAGSSGLPTAVFSKTRSAAGVWGPTERLAGNVGFGGLDVNAAGRAVLAYNNVVRVRPRGQVAWGPEQQISPAGTQIRQVAIGGDGTSTAWWAQLSRSNESTPPAQ